MYTNWKPPGGFGGAERPGVYGRGGGFAQRPPMQYNIPSGGRGNGLPVMGQPPGAERPGVYGNPGQFNPMPRGPLPDLPNGGRGNGLPVMGGQPGIGGPLPPYQGGGVTGYVPGAPGIGTGVGNPAQTGSPDPNNITRGGGTMGGSGYYGMPYGWRGLLGG